MGLAAEQERYATKHPSADGQPNVVVDQHEALAVTNIFRERSTAFRQAAAKNSHRVLVAFARLVALLEKITIDLQKIGARLCHGHAFDSICQAPDPSGVRG